MPDLLIKCGTCQAWTTIKDLTEDQKKAIKTKIKAVGYTCKGCRYRANYRAKRERDEKRQA